MRITDLLQTDGITLNATPANKTAAIELLVNLQQKVGNLTDTVGYQADILARESQGSTAIGCGIAVPHAKSRAVKHPGLAAITVPQGVDYEAPDGKPTDLLFMIAAPQDGGDVHLEMLSRLMVLLMDEDFRTALGSAKEKQEFLALIDKAELEKYPDEVVVKTEVPTKGGYRILAVTACPTGIAHTYMAAESLEKKGRELGISLKAETQGSGGAKNVLTRAEIAACDGILIAADKNVDLSRFDGKPVLKTPVSDGINKPQELIQKILDGKAPIYHHEGGTTDSSEEKESLGRQIYKHLMNGVSHMLPFVIGGGILIALAFLFDAGAVNDSNFAQFGTITPIAAFFKGVGGLAFGFMLPILAGYIAMSIADRPGLAMGFVGGALASSGATFASFADPSVAIVPAGFLGALVAGFAAGYLMLGLRFLCDKLPKALEGIKPVLLYPLIGILSIGVVMCAINPFMAMINTAIMNGLTSLSGTSAVLLGVVVAGMMAIDMGGPFNKAAYLFGTASLVSASGAAVASPIMAAVMVGGMVPPIAIALACTFFQNRFTMDERKSGVVNYIMGLCFITEGAIPFAASDPLRVIPSCIAGSAVAGGLSMFFQCTLPAPHGGLFVFPVMGNILFYILALAIGSVVGMLMLALLKKRKLR